MEDTLFVTESHHTHGDLEEISSASVKVSKGISANKVAKVWQISEMEARRTLDFTYQRCKYDSDYKLSSNLPTNDHMLRYRSKTCMHLFVSRIGFVFVVPMKTKGEFFKALKLFAKEIGVHLDLILDHSGEQTSNTAKQFCHKNGTTL
mmetsp:Transcript_16997/g.20759  ORF Transcript_16997/g.20759 Transcript_16997/m.20759 type:complete len:148 (-) Transcript_16997:1002-1445(-)